MADRCGSHQVSTYVEIVAQWDSWFNEEKNDDNTDIYTEQFSSHLHDHVLDWAALILHYLEGFNHWGKIINWFLEKRQSVTGICDPL